VSDGYFIGLISGTSRDGVDAALVLFEQERPRLLHALCLPYQEPLKSELGAAVAAGRLPAETHGGRLDELLGRHFARAARMLTDQAGIEMRDVAAIGSHGQTVWHDPHGDPPCSIQLGNAGVLSRSTGVTVVSDFRRADIEAGGEGAPLAPLLHRRIFSVGHETRAVLNLGGIANLTFLHAGGGAAGHDCGPANCLLDLWYRMHHDGDYDPGGRWAAGGSVREDLLEAMLADPYFRRPPPKSTGLEYFNHGWLTGHLDNFTYAPGDVQSTLAELTARSVAADVRAAQPAVQRLLVCGGGVHNIDLLSRLAALLPETIVESTRHHGVHPDWVEALLFAWLARERIAGRPQDTRLVTGAREPVLLGDVRLPPAAERGA